MHRRRPLGAAAALLAALIALLSGCGSGAAGPNGIAAESPQQILAAAETAAAGAATARLAGSIVSAGKPISLKMELVSGKGGAGEVTLAGLAIDLVQVDGWLYARGSASFYREFADPSAARVLAGKWLKARANRGPFAALATLTDLRRLIDGTLSEHGQLEHAPARSIDGRPAVGITDNAGGGTLYVAATGTPYPLEITGARGRSGDVRFDRWNQPVTLTAPANPINISQLQGGG